MSISSPTPTLPEREGEKAPPLGAGGASGALYHFNPLIIIELTGNLHFEAVVICFLFLAYRSLSKIKSPLRRFGKVFSVKKTSSSTQNLTPKSPLRKGEGTFYKNLIAPLRKGERTFYKNLIAPLRKGEGTFCKNLIAPLLRGGVDAGLFLSAFFFACAVSTKMLPLILMPLIVKQLGLKKGLIYASIVGIFTLLFFVPFIDTLLSEKLFSSINLYFQKFEFNASIYYLVREIGFKLLGYNIIGTAGKVMAFLIFGGIVFISWKSKNLFNGALGVLTLYFAMATTVHPWYVSTLVAITIFSKFRYPIVWSYLIFLSYATYQTNLYQENLWLVFVEYSAVLGVIIYEWKSHKIIKENK